jgi:hypothetical protein
MKNAFTVRAKFKLARRGRSGQRVVEASPSIQPATGRVPRIARLMALAIRLDGLIRSGVIKDQAEVARLGRVSRARVSQIMNLLHLAPDIQAQLLFLPPVEEGRARIIIADLQSAAAEPNWRKQRRKWDRLCTQKAS